jgi:sialidase-1
MMARPVCVTWGRLLGRLAAACGLSALCAAASGPPEQIDLHVSGRDGYHTYRIPSVIVTKQGTVLAFCEGRKTHPAIRAIFHSSSCTTSAGRTLLPVRSV